MEELLRELIRIQGETLAELRLMRSQGGGVAARPEGLESLSDMEIDARSRHERNLLAIAAKGGVKSAPRQRKAA